MDPDDAFLAPESVARRVHGDLPSMLIGGLSALLLQSLHPLAMAGVADHSNYRDDALGRLRRTASFVGYTTFGTVEQADEAIEQVRRVHRRVHGVAPDGRPYSADDPDLVTWIHVAEMASFLASCQRFGRRPVTAAERDAYWADTAPVARALGAEWVPATADEATAYLQRVRPALYAGPQALAARDFLLRGVGRRPNDRAVHARHRLGRGHPPAGLGPRGAPDPAAAARRPAARHPSGSGVLHRPPLGGGTAGPARSVLTGPQPPAPLPAFAGLEDDDVAYRTGTRRAGTSSARWPRPSADGRHRRACRRYNT